MLQNASISSKCCSNSEKKYYGFHKNISSTTVFDNDNNKKCFLSISILEWWKIM